MAAPAEAESSQPLAPAPAPPPPPEKKKLQRAPSPARPKDVPGWSLAKSRRGNHPGSPVAFSGKPGAAVAHSRRLGGPKDGRGDRKGKAGPSVGARGSGKGAAGRPGARIKARGRLAAAGEGAAAAAGGSSSTRSRLPPALSLTDSSSEGSDCSASEGAKLLALLELGGLSGSDTESPPSSSAPPAQPASAASAESPLPPDDPSTAASVASSRLPLSTSLAFSDLTEELLDAGVARELEELRSENDYLKVRAAPSGLVRGSPTGAVAQAGSGPWQRKRVVPQNHAETHGEVFRGRLALRDTLHSPREDLFQHHGAPQPIRSYEPDVLLATILEFE
uniref:Uncharacterized protein n=1 Tax=Sphaerodactylus townsendi TaxID=933632 RepID=A0ACB8F711_9SAUR